MLWTLKWLVVMFYILLCLTPFLNRFALIGFVYSPGNAICVGKHTNVGELLYHSKHGFCLYNFLSRLKLPYILCYAYISQSLEKGAFPVKSHELPFFVDICFFSFLCPFSWRRKCGNRLSLLLIRAYGTSQLPHMGPVL